MASWQNKKVEVLFPLPLAMTFELDQFFGFFGCHKELALTMSFPFWFEQYDIHNK